LLIVSCHEENEVIGRKLYLSIRLSPQSIKQVKQDINKPLSEAELKTPIFLEFDPLEHGVHIPWP